MTSVEIAAKMACPNASSKQLLIESVKSAIEGVSLRSAALFTKTPEPNKFVLTQEEIADLTDTLTAVITNGEVPSNYFTYLGEGSYKECYYLDSKHRYVVKFVTDLLEVERATLIRATAEGVDNFFIPTTFIPFFGYCVPAVWLEDSEIDENEVARNYGWIEDGGTHTSHWEPPYFIAAEIQPCIDHLYSNMDNFHPDFGFNAAADAAFLTKNALILADPHTGDTLFEWEAAKLTPIKNFEWISDAILCHGIPAMRRLGDFLSKYSITDLHTDNLGLISGVPVFIDWYTDKMPRQANENAPF